MRGTVRAVVAGLAVATMSPAAASAAASLDAAQRQAAVTQLATALRERYVYPDVGATAAGAIEASLRAGAYV
jgi:hypothetical protein